jgi:hypothetical protein
VLAVRTECRHQIRGSVGGQLSLSTRIQIHEPDVEVSFPIRIFPDIRRIDDFISVGTGRGRPSRPLPQSLIGNWN